MSTWLIVRHALTPWNLEGRIQGHTDIPLSELGFRQAESLKARLAEWDIHAAYASDLKRAMETARTILDSRKVPLSPAPEIREFGFGRWEGMTHQEVQEADPELYAQMLERHEGFAPPGGESLRDLMARVGEFVGRLKQTGPYSQGEPTSESQACERARSNDMAPARTASEVHDKGDTLLIVGHGGSLRVLLTCLLDLPSPAAWRFYLDPASLSVVDCHRDNAVLRLFNDTSFLP